MMQTSRRYWPTLKKHVHILGEVRRVAHGQGAIASLYLYETSRERSDEPEELPPARAKVIIGACKEIRCTICGELVDWEEAPTEAYLRLIRHFVKVESV